MKVLLVCPYPPDADALGGTQVHTAALAREAAADVEVLTAHVRGDTLVVQSFGPRSRRGTDVALLPLGAALDDPLRPPPGLAAALASTILASDVDLVHLHSPLLGPEAIVTAVRAARAPLVLTLHDHALACIEPRLLDEHGGFCGIPTDERRCDTCLATGHGMAEGSLGRWRAATAPLVALADAVVAPSRSVVDLVARVHPTIRDRDRLVTMPWGVPASMSRGFVVEPAAAPSVPRGRRVLRVAVVGLLSPEKGGEVLPDLLRGADGPELEWHLFGATEGRSIAALRRAAARVRIHGAYARERLPALLARAACDLVVLPSVAPESFSLVLSEVLAAGLPVAVSDRGALAERVRELDVGWTFDPRAPETLRSVFAAIAADTGSLAAARARVRKLPVRTEADVARDHVALWRSVVAAPRRREAVVRADVEEARRSFAAGTDAANAGSHRAATMLVRAADALRRTSFYRDLPLRAWISVAERERIERTLRRWLART